MPKLGCRTRLVFLLSLLGMVVAGLLPSSAAAGHSDGRAAAPMLQTDGHHPPAHAETAITAARDVGQTGMAMGCCAGGANTACCGAVIASAMTTESGVLAGHPSGCRRMRAPATRSDRPTPTPPRPIPA